MINREQKAYVILGQARTGQRGVFLAPDPAGRGFPVSPVAASGDDVDAWARANGWRRSPFEPAHPEGVYLRG